MTTSSTTAPIARPQIDPELRQILDLMPAPGLDAGTLPEIRGFAATPSEGPAALLEAGGSVVRSDHTATAPDGTAVPLTVLRPSGRDRSTPAPVVYWMHGGGMVMGDRFSNIDIPLEWLDRFGAVVVTVDYRLAPEATGSVPVEDCYAGLLWLVGHADELGIDPARLVVAGTSAGGGLAAGVTLLARDRGTPAIAAQLLACPMLDHRNDTVSSHQFAQAPGTWTRGMNAFGWRSVLGDTPAEEVSSYVSPALAGDFSGLPDTYVDAGSAEVFRDEDVAYASRIWAAGGQAELHLWAGGFHGFDALAPDAKVSAAARRARLDWLTRVLGAA